MQEQSQFSIQLRKYIKMLISIWPSLRPGLRSIPDITGPHQNSLLPSKNYRAMNSEVFLQTIIDDLHLFIMEHDVKDEDLQDYLYEILDLLHIDEQITSSNSQVGGIRYMSRQIMKVITELQQGKNQSIQKFQKNIYNPVMQMGIGEAIVQGDESSDQQDDDQIDQQGDQIQQQEDEEGNWTEEDEMEQESKEKHEQQKLQTKKSKKQHEKTQEELEREKELEDDGWVIVKKK